MLKNMAFCQKVWEWDISHASIRDTQLLFAN